MQDALTKGDTATRQTSVLEVIETLSSELALRPLLTKIVDHACDLLSAEHGVIGLVDKDAHLVRTEAVCNTPEDELGAESPEGVGLAGCVLKEKRPVVLDRYGDLEHPTRPEMLDHTVIGIPVMWRGEMLGFFGVSAPPPRRFTEGDADVLSFLAKHAAIAIHNAQLFEREQRRVARVTTVGRVGQLITSSLSLDETLQTAVEAISQQLSYSSAGIFLVDPMDDSRLVLKTRSGVRADVAVGSYSQRIGEGNVGLAAARRQFVHVEDVRRDPHYIPFAGAETLRSELALPLIVGGRLLGILNIESEHAISRDDLTGLEIIAGQLGVAIDNVRLFEESERALSEMYLLYETSRRMSMAMDVKGVVEAYLAQVATKRRYGCSVFVFSHDEAGEREEIVLLGRWQPSTGITYPNSRVPYFEDAFDAVLDAGQVVTIADTETDTRVSETLRKAQRAWPALVLIPLMADGRRIGGVSLRYPQSYEWPETDLRPYQITAAQLALVLESRRQQQRLLEQEQHLAATEERRRLSRDLHDSVSQLLFSMTLVAQSIGPTMKKSVSAGEARVATLLDLAQSARSEMRSLLVELRTPSASQRPLSDLERLHRDGLVASLQHLAEQVSTPKLQVRLNVKRYKRQSSHVEEALFRVVQEALNNVVKHAQACRVTVDLLVDEDAQACRVTIQDDGKGFDINAHKSGHFGLKTMRERAEALGGTLEIASSREGTCVNVVVPLTQTR